MVGRMDRSATVSFRTVWVARVYLSERKGRLDSLLEQLHHRWKVHGVTVYRGIAGYGDSGKLHTSRVLDVSFDLPITVEFYDTPDRMSEVLSQLEGVKPGHAIVWEARMWMGAGEET